MLLRSRAVLLVATLVVPPGMNTVHALEQDRNLPFQVNAANVEIDQKTGAAVYRGKVVLSQGSMRIEADRVDVRTENRRMTTVIASGKPVRIQALLDNRDGQLLANAERVTYRAATRDVELTGNAWVRQGADEFRAQRIIYALDDERLNASGTNSGDGRVQAIIHPRTGKKDGKP